MSKKKIVKGYVLDCVIGEGAYATVYKGFARDDRNRKVAIKHFKLDRYTSERG
jgi:hypothetical protein